MRAQFRVETANKVQDGRTCGTLYGVALVIEGARYHWVMEPQDSEVDADNFARRLPKFLSGYIECALWSSTDGDGRALDDNHDADDFANDTLRSMADDCAAFMRDNAADLETLDDSQAGHDFWLTRNRHGAGFWDRGLGALGDRLTNAAHVYGSCDLYVGDDGKVYE